MKSNFYLYVEDDASNRLVMKMIMEKILKTNNYAVFENSIDFMARLRSLPQKPSILLLDIHISPLNGFQMLNLVRTDPYYQESIVVALTASVMNEEVEKLRESGFDGAIGKPISLTTFPALINRLLKGEKVWQI